MGGDSSGSATNGGRSVAVIFTAMKVEYMAVREHVTTRTRRTVVNGTEYESGRIRGHDRMKWTVVLAETGVGNAAAAAAVERAIMAFLPQVVLFVGVAGGTKDVHHGDVVVAEVVHNYESGKDHKQGYQPRPMSIRPSALLVGRARAVDLKRWWERTESVIQLMVDDVR